MSVLWRHPLGAWRYPLGAWIERMQGNRASGYHICKMVNVMFLMLNVKYQLIVWRGLQITFKQPEETRSEATRRNAEQARRKRGAARDV